MTSIDHLTLEVADVASAERFYADAFGLGERLRLRASEAPTSGFRGFKKVATSAKKDTGPATREIDDVVLLRGAADVGASKRPFTDPDGFEWEASAR